MKIPCIERVSWIVSGLAFLQSAMTSIQFYNLTLVASALILGIRFRLTDISLSWIKEKGISTLSYFFSDAKYSIQEMQKLYAIQVLSLYKIQEGGYFLIDDTLEHHSRFSRWIHGVCCLYDHVLKTNLKAVCIVFLYFTDGGWIRFPINLRIFYKEEGSGMPWEKGQPRAHKTKNALALEMIEQALGWGFPKSTVLADSWFCVSPFIQGLDALELPYVLEMKSSYQIKVPCVSPNLTPKGRLAKKQFDLFSPEKFFANISSSQACGLEWDENTGKAAKVLYHTKIATVEFNAFAGKFRVVQSINPVAGTTKYFLSNQLHWDAVKILWSYSHRWMIEEFFRNAKQLCDLEGASLRSEQGVTLSLYLVSWIDFLLHHQNYKNVSEKLTKESLSIPSIIRIAQAQNAEAFIQHIQQDAAFSQRWIASIKEKILRPQKSRKPLVALPSAETLSLPVPNP